MEIILKYFPGLSPEASLRLEQLGGLYREWNEKINVISRNDMEHLYERHVLYSLAIALHYPWIPGTTVLDVGTGGGFPGIPLAILFPEVQFTLVDSIGKKMRVVEEVAGALGLGNVEPLQERVEKMHRSFDFVVSRAVTALPAFVSLAGARVARRGVNPFPNGIIYLKGGDFGDELLQLKGWYHKTTPLSNCFSEPFFETKKLVFLSRNRMEHRSAGWRTGDADHVPSQK
jgi:16S rRNA (guanine527-N7)-methyltransferase